MIIFISLLNFPWTLVGLLGSILSIPRSVRFSNNPPAVIIYVRSLWWYRWLSGQAGIRAMTNGHVVQVSKWADELDLKHELIHVEQHIRMPLFFPVLYLIEQIRHGGYQGNGKGNKYEVEAYEKSGSRFGYKEKAPDGDGTA